MNKIQFFKKNVKQLIPKLGIQDEIIVRRDNRLGRYCACISLYLYCDTQEPVYLMNYNTNQIKKMTKAEIINLILHELGHIKLKHEYKKSNTKELRIQMEYEAEKFAFENIKKYYPQYKKKLLKNLKNDKDRNTIYKKAFQKLVEEENV